MHVRLVDTPAAWDALQPGWDALLEQGPVPSPFLCWDWVRTWWDVFGSRFALCLLVAEQDGACIGLAPFMRGAAGGLLARRWRRLMFIGQQGDTRAEALDLIVAPGHEEAVAQAFAAQLCGPLRRTWDALLLEAVPQDAPGVAALRTALATLGRRTATCAPVAAPYLALPATWEAFLEGRSRNFLAQLRQARNRLARAGEVRVRRAGEDLETAAGLAVLADLHKERWGERTESFRTQAYVDFHARFAERMQVQDRLYLAVLEVDGRTVAARYDYRFGRRLWCMQGGWDPAFAECRPGTIMTADVVQWGIEHGYTAYEFLAGDEAYKRRWADAERTFVDVIGANPATLRGRLYARHPALREVRT